MSIYPLNHCLWWSCVQYVVTTLLLCSPLALSAAGQFVVTTSPDQSVTLKANKASLKAVVEQIAHNLNIEIESKLSGDEMVTDEFNNLPLERALQRLSPGYITVSKKKGGKVAKIFLLPQGHQAPSIGTPSRPAVTATSQTQESEIRNAGPEPFKFVFDPSEDTHQQ